MNVGHQIFERRSNAVGVELVKNKVYTISAPGSVAVL
jgi:hypothetical protein